MSGLTLAVAGDSPADAGLEPVGGVDSEVRRASESAGAGAASETPGAPTLRVILANAPTVLGEAETWLCGAVLFAGTGVNVTVIGLWGIPYLVQTYGLSVTRASTFTLLGSAGLLLGPPAVGAVSDRLGSRTRLVVAGMWLYTLALAVLAPTGDPPLAVVAVVLIAPSALAGAFALNRAAIMPTLMGYVLDAYWTDETIGGARIYTEFGYRVAFGLAAPTGFGAFLAAVWLQLRTDGAIV
jgi:nitrate/nitrite transporter NarK